MTNFATSISTTTSLPKKSQVFPNRSFVELKDNKPWKTLIGEIIEGTGVVEDYTPDTGYLVKVGKEYIWCKESELCFATSNPVFNLESFVSGTKAFTRCDCTAKFLKFDKKNITYQVVAEVNCDGKITHQSYTKEGILNKGIDGDFDMLFMQNPHIQEELVFNQKKEVMPESKLEVKEVKQDIEKELTEMLILQVQETENKPGKEKPEWTEWFFKYLKSGIYIAEIEDCKVSDIEEVVGKYMTKIIFKA